MRELSYYMSPSFVRERKSWRDKRCPLNGRYNIKDGLTITKGRARNNGEIFREHKKRKEPISQKNSCYIVGRKGGTHYNQVLSDCESLLLALCTISAAYLYSLFYRVFKKRVTYFIIYV
jgi:hypothetical protein